MKLKFVAAAIAMSAFGGYAHQVTGAHAQASSSKAAYAEAKGNSVYASDYFGLSIKVPDSWVLASEDEAEKILQTGSEMVAGSDKAMKRSMDASIRKSLPVMFVSRHAMSAGKSDNINISSIAENVAPYPFIKRGSQYFDNMKLIASKSATPITFEEGYGTRMIGGTSFDTMSATISIGNVTIGQEYYATRMGDHIVSMIATYLTEEDRLILDGIVDTIEIK